MSNVKAHVDILKEIWVHWARLGMGITDPTGLAHLLLDSCTVTSALSHTVSEINTDFSQNSQIFPTSAALNTDAERVSSWNFVMLVGLKKLPESQSA